MDSFYGAPRQPPPLPTINPIQRIPLVPEVSIIDNSAFPASRKTFDFNSATRPNSDSFIHMKKHVRFKNHHNEPTLGKENLPQTLKAVPDLNGKTFKQIYMANVPDRHLDLSIFESPKHNLVEPPRQNTETNNWQLSKQCDSFVNVTPTTCNPQFNDLTLKSIENTTSNTNWRPRDQNLFTTSSDRVNLTQTHRNKTQHCTEICTQTEPQNYDKCTDIATPSDEPTLKDLYRLIQQQNEQIMNLQHQVNSLKTSQQPEVDDTIPRPFLKDLNSPSKKSLFSFGVKATSVEFSFRAPHKLRKNEFVEPKIQEIEECDNSTSNQSNSLHLNESFEVKSGYVSNVQSIAIEMGDYQNSDEEGEGEEGEIQLSLCNDIMNQVTNVLKNAQKYSECGQAPVNNFGQTLHNNLSPIQEASEVTRNTDIDVENCTESEVSYAVQQLLMKYLPSEKLPNVSNKPKLPTLKLKPSNKEMSFATLQYLKKYNLIDNTKNVDQAKKLPVADPKILNLTALKMQRKHL
ncbi:hypothetical protein Zmor_028206 [Zophobas morio]|uniref:Uncharacterized protein n=1 Tax=Zophobas morio TaxID=2755281 RepID=A0AA38M3T2_9CUCU|nr:hypothetical protein Zmor_028206 [Zophobas morio]